MSRMDEPERARKGVFDVVSENEDEEDTGRRPRTGCTHEGYTGRSTPLRTNIPYHSFFEKEVLFLKTQTHRMVWTNFG